MPDDSPACGSIAIGALILASVIGQVKALMKFRRQAILASLFLHLMLLASITLCRHEAAPIENMPPVSVYPVFLAPAPDHEPSQAAPEEPPSRTTASLTAALPEPAASTPKVAPMHKKLSAPPLRKRPARAHPPRIEFQEDAARKIERENKHAARALSDSPAATASPGGPLTGDQGEKPSTHPAESNQAGGDAAAAGQSAENEDLAAIRRLIMEHVVFPNKARRSGLTGKLIIAFLLRQDGTVTDIEIVTSSGYAIIDQSVVATLQQLSPLPPPRQQCRILVPLTFTLQ